MLVAHCIAHCVARNVIRTGLHWKLRTAALKLQVAEKTHETRGAHDIPIQLLE